MQDIVMKKVETIAMKNKIGERTRFTMTRQFEARVDRSETA
jgi:hypothetical protein